MPRNPIQGVVSLATSLVSMDRARRGPFLGHEPADVVQLSLLELCATHPAETIGLHALVAQVCKRVSNRVRSRHAKRIGRGTPREIPCTDLMGQERCLPQEPPAPDSDNPIAAATRREARVDEELAKLPSAQQQILRDRYWRELTFDQIAQLRGFGNRQRAQRACNHAERRIGLRLQHLGV